MSARASHSPQVRTRVLIFLHAFADGGAEAVFVRLANELRRRGRDVVVVVAQATGSNRRALDPEVRVVDLAAPRMAAALPALARALRAEKPDACISALTHSNLALIAASRLARTKARIIVSERRSLVAEFGEGPAWKGRVKKALIRALYPRADGIVAVSEALRNELETFIPRAARRITTIYNPVDADALVARAAAAPTIAPTPPGVPVIAFVGRLAPQKNVPLLLEAFQRLRQTRPAHLVIAGQGPLEAELRAMAGQLSIDDDVTFAGYLDNPYGLMSGADVLALPSNFEGLPNVLIETLAFDTQIVSTDCPTGPREILVDGRYGRLVPVGDAAAFARALGQALDAPLARDRGAALEPYAGETVYSRYIQVLEKGADHGR